MDIRFVYKDNSWLSYAYKKMLLQWDVFLEMQQLQILMKLLKV